MLIFLFSVQALEVMKKCILSISHYETLSDVLRDMLLCDSSIHNSLFRIICMTTQSLEVSCIMSLPVLSSPQNLYFSFVIVVRTSYAESLC